MNLSSEYILRFLSSRNLIPQSSILSDSARHIKFFPFKSLSQGSVANDNDKKEKKKNYKCVATFPSDTPFFDNSIVEKYFEEIKNNQSRLYFIKSNEKRHNIFGLWSVELMDILEDDLVKKNFRKVEEWSNKIGVKTINIKFNEFDPFLNINTKEDLIKAEKIFKKFEK